KIYDTISSLEEAKVRIMGEFLKKHNCDIIVHPTFPQYRIENITVKGKSSVSRIEIEIAGYPAQYVNIHTYNEKQDTLNMELINRLSTDVQRDSTIANTSKDYIKLPKKRAPFLIGGTVLTALLIGLLL